MVTSHLTATLLCDLEELGEGEGHQGRQEGRCQEAFFLEARRRRTQEDPIG